MIIIKRKEKRMIKEIKDVIGITILATILIIFSGCGTKTVFPEKINSLKQRTLRYSQRIPLQ
jgi:hypothetical protein